MFQISLILLQMFLYIWFVLFKTQIRVTHFICLICVCKFVLPLFALLHFICEKTKAFTYRVLTFKILLIASSSVLYHVLLLPVFAVNW